MIIQNEKTNVSIPKEWMSFYNYDTQDYSTTMPQYREAQHISKNGNDATWNITPSGYKVDSELSINTYGWLYGYDSIVSMGTLTYNFSNDISEYKGDPSVNDYANYTYAYISESKNSDTGVTTKKYSTYSRVPLFLLTKKEYVFGNPSIVFSADMPVSTSFTPVDVYFTFSASASYSATIPNSVVVGANKNTKAYNFYLENTALKNELAAKADQYTTINLYHLDGTEWS